MKALVQRVSQAKVTVEGETTGEIKEGLLIFLGITHEDTEKEAEALLSKILNLRLFEGESGHFDHSVSEVNGELLIVSQFTLYGSCKKGRRPDFTAAAKPEKAEGLYNHFVKKTRETGLKTATGRFGAMMSVDLTNEGPATFIIET